MPNIFILAIIVSAGVIGGSVNFATSRTESSTLKDWMWSLIIGIGAALLVPLFLNTISSSLLSDILNSSSSKTDIYVFAGFCILGAISSKTMIHTLTQQLLKDTEKNKNDIKMLNTKVAPVIDKETETDTPSNAKASVSPGIPNNLIQILRALAGSQYSLRTVSGIANNVASIESAVVTDLRELSSMGLAEEVQSDMGVRWYITPEGRKLVQDYPS